MARTSSITFEDRLNIEKLLKQGLSTYKIARRIGRPRTSIVYEVERLPKGEYNAVLAQSHKDNGAQNQWRRKFKVFTNDEIKIIESLMQQGKSRSFIRRTLKCSYIALEHWMDRTSPEYQGGALNTLDQRLSNIEQQIEILFDLIKQTK